ncbi:MAG: sugar-binding domain-containing protein [Aquiluna sp.]|jgi:deoxyribonucleoside regulator
MTQLTSGGRANDLARVAEMHFIQRMDQKLIASRIHASRSTVSRMLKEAIDSGIVDFKINHPLARDSQLEKQLSKTLKLREVWVSKLESATTRDEGRIIGELGARCIDQQIPKIGSLAICWGSATKLVVESLETNPDKHVHVIQMIGSMGTSDSTNDGVELTKMAARRLKGTYELLNAPLVVDDEASALSLLRQSAISRVLDAAEAADCALVGLGAISLNSSALVAAGYLTADEVSDALVLGAVGDVSGILIDSGGKEVVSKFSSRVIGLKPPRIKNIKNTVAVAFGQDKLQIIQAAALGEYIDILITDSSTARSLISSSMATSHSTEGGTSSA